MWHQNRPYHSPASQASPASQSSTYPYTSPPLNTDYLYQKGGSEDKPIYLVSPEELLVVNRPILSEQDGGAEAQAEGAQAEGAQAEAEAEIPTLDEPNEELNEVLIEESTEKKKGSIIPDKVGTIVLSMGVSKDYSQLVGGIFLVIGVILFLFLCLGFLRLYRGSTGSFGGTFQNSWTGPSPGSSSVSLKKGTISKPHTGFFSNSSARPSDFTKLRRKIFG